MPNGGRGHRRMYRLTGLPGWMRFGFSPGWMGMNPYGLGPGATYLMTGQWPTPQAQAQWQAMQAGQVPYPSYPGAMPFYGAAPGAMPPYRAAPGAMPPYGAAAGAMPPYGAPPGAMPFAPQVTPEQELDFLKNQAQAIKGQLDQIEARIGELETGEE